jgi:SOS response regulatory protein OraA/RecX
MSFEDPLQEIKDRALRLLAGHARSASALQARLTAEGYDPTLVAQTLERLNELKLIDDASLVRSRAESLLTERLLGPARAIERLIAQGFGEQQARCAVRELLDGKSERDLAQALLVRRGVSEASSLDARQRAARALVSRGFDEELIRSLLGL